MIFSDGVYQPTFQVPTRKTAVNSLAFYSLRDSSQNTGGYLFAGIKDGSIEMYLLSDQVMNLIPIQVLNAHSANG